MSMPGLNNTPSVSAESVRFSVAGRALVDGVSLALQPGKLSVLVGPNGAGKSTLIKLMTGELAAQSGRILYQGEELRRLRPWQLACKRAVMAQSESMSFPFVVHDIVRMGHDGLGRPLSRAERMAAIERALRTANVEHLAARRYQTLSGGERQRVQFARVLCQLHAGQALEATQTLFLDEPVASLDLHHQIGLLDAVRALTRKGLAAMAVLHDLNLAIAYADEIVLLNDGKVVASGTPAAVITPGCIAKVFGVDPALVAGGARPAVLPQGFAAMERQAV
jgi:iron complex transport system ATP-binding protein